MSREIDLRERNENYKAIAKGLIKAGAPVKKPKIKSNVV
jgi:hypothetical protein